MCWGGVRDSEVYRPQVRFGGVVLGLESLFYYPRIQNSILLLVGCRKKSLCTLYNRVIPHV